MNRTLVRSFHTMFYPLIFLACFVNRNVSDRSFGGALLLCTVILFTYFTAWSLFTPFFPADSQLHVYFPGRLWAIRLPSLILVLGLGIVGVFIGVLVVKETDQSQNQVNSP
ncbi:hypothetical protein IE53DRAFT_131570 [Violaceomyces palustris]|uniref:Uncharacterized protein n=1 Tax=Violaceomyces palustris TaxID=1673888 RepID=A0ACD0NV81_9BASI|nr:hypothetical protein IE53DRAFT_131570 [Violaceomyces palustris]